MTARGVDGLRIGVTEDAADAPVAAALRRHGALVTLGAARLLHAAVDGGLEALAVTEASAARELAALAGRLGLHDGLKRATRRHCAVAAADAATAEALELTGLPVTVLPHQPRTGKLVGALDRWAQGRTDGTAPLIAGQRWPVELSPEACVVQVDHRAVVLGELQFAVLAALVRRPGVVCSHQFLLGQAWEDDQPDATRVKHHISRIRDKLGPAGECIETVRGIGYRYVPRPDGRSGHPSARGAPAGRGG